jgi:tetratricopeptide (TPR) repeat protein
MLNPLVILMGLAALAAPGNAAAPAAAAETGRPAVVDEVVMFSATAPGQDGERLPCRVRDFDKDAKKLWVIVDDGQRQGPWSVPLDRVKRIDYDVDGRRAELPPGDNAARYRFALWLLSVGLKDDALFDLEAVVGKTGVPAEAWLALARLQEEKGKFREALKSIEEYLKAMPDDAEALAARKRLEAKVKALPEPTQADVKPDPKVGPVPDPPKADPDKGCMEVRDGWRAQPWANPADISLLKDDKTGNQFLAAQMPGTGKADKTAIGLRVNGDVSRRSKLVYNFYNADKQNLPVSVAFNTASGFYETQTTWMKPGWNEGLVVDLNSSDYKCAATEWAYKSPLKDKDQVSSILFLINARRNTTIYLDYVHFE